MSLTENSAQVFLPGGCNRTQNLRFGPYTKMFYGAKHWTSLECKLYFLIAIVFNDIMEIYLT